MPKRTDIKKILMIGSGPIIISQACEFDYSGTQACKALKEEGYEVILVNSNPATIMTDPEMADRTYVEPITWQMVAKIIEKERPDALLPTVGGQTGLNVAMQLADKGILQKFNVKMIGASIEAIKKAEDRSLFKKAMQNIGLDLPISGLAHNIEEAEKVLEEMGLPLVIRPAYTLGGTGGGVAYNADEYREVVKRGIEQSMIGEVLIEESIIGWKEYELEVMRDLNDNVVIVCSIENFDPMGVHTGDSITVAPAQTLTDMEYQKMRDASIAVIRGIGVDTGGSNIQFAVNPADGRMVVIEMNPRVSRSSALASKATGFPIAKFAAKLAVGYTLDEISNDITKKTPASFEPTIDYCVVKMPRWAFEKFPGSDPTLTTYMKSVGETMAIGRTFKEAFQKGLRGLEIGRYGLGADGKDKSYTNEEIKNRLIVPTPERPFFIKYALKSGFTVDDICKLSRIDPWFIDNIKEIVEVEAEIEAAVKKHWVISNSIPPDVMLKAKRYGFSDLQLAHIMSTDEMNVRNLRKKAKIEATFKLVDTCAAEFESYTPYYYSTYESECEVVRSDKKKIMILGGGPNRIGQGIEFDYCCVHASWALKEEGWETIMVNSNPETVSTDYDTSDKLYFEPVTLEDVLNIVDKEKPDGVIVQLGGQTPLNLAKGLEAAGVRIIGTSPDSIDIAEDRDRFKKILHKLNLLQPDNGTARSEKEAVVIAERVGYPVVVRPSYVLGGRGMEIVYDSESLTRYMKTAVEVSGKHPVLIDKFLEDAIEVDVDMIADGEAGVIGGIMEHIEEAGVHSGDSAMVLPAYSLKKEALDKIRKYTYDLAKELKVVGLMNVQYAVKNGTVYILEVNPRASRTVPFVSKAIGIPLAKIAAKVMAGMKLKDLNFTEEVIPKHISVKESVLPFIKFPGVDIILGPEMRSTGEVMGIDDDFGKAFIKSQIAAGQILPKEGRIFVSVKDKDKKCIVPIIEKLAKMGFSFYATEGTADAISGDGINVERVMKVHEGRSNILDLIKDKKVDLVINTPTGKGARADEALIRSLAVSNGIPCITTIPGARASLEGILSLKNNELDVKPLQAYHGTN